MTFDLETYETHVRFERRLCETNVTLADDETRVTITTKYRRNLDQPHGHLCTSAVDSIHGLDTQDLAAKRILYRTALDLIREQALELQTILDEIDNLDTTPTTDNTHKEPPQ